MSLAIGIDISKQKIDVYWDGSYAQLDNDKKSIKAYFQSLDRSSNIVMEATGKYHRLAHRLLETMGFRVMVVNPYQSKHFARAMNLLCKTDKVDAKMLALFAEKMPFEPRGCANEQQQNIQDLSRHLDDLKKIRADLSARKRDAKGFIKGSLDKAIKAVGKEIQATEAALQRIIHEDDELDKHLSLLLSIPGVGEATAISLLSYLRELGTVGRCEISALSGLAPINNDSGMFKGKRRIRGGRRDVRSHLYMPIVGAATRHNERLKVFYDRLVGHGKPKKVALTACMRKLVVWANAILASGQPWTNDYAKNC